MDNKHARDLLKMIDRDLDWRMYDNMLLASATRLLEHIASTICEQPVQVAFTSQIHNGKVLAISADMV